MEKANKCSGCKYCLADSNSQNAYPYKCINQDSPYFGEHAQKEECKQYEPFEPKPKMTFKDALDILVMFPAGAYPHWFFKFGKEDETERPFHSVSFVNNKQMLLYREASMVCFAELMKMKKEAGDFDDEEGE